MFVPIANSPRDYAWGSTTAIADYLGRPASGGPEAELWLGAHPGSPAQIEEPSLAGGARDLVEWIAADANAALGATHASAAKLPFLLKVLAAASPLSLQAHPTPEKARAGFELENADGKAIDAYDRNYRDPFHKPELVVAASERFDALCGFRPLEQTRELFAELRGLDSEQQAAFDGLDARLASDEPLREAVEWLLRDGRGEDSGQVSWLVERVVAASARAVETLPESPYRASYETVARLQEQYPGDPGVVISLLLNRVTLARGEALYLPAGNIHAYLEGLGIELMAASDNVLRGGLTAKHVDVTELVDVLDFSPVPPPRLDPIAVAEGVQLFRPDVPDFQLYRVQQAAGAPVTVELTGPAIALVVDGSLSLANQNETLPCERGASVYITNEPSITISGTGECFIATTGV